MALVLLLEGVDPDAETARWKTQVARARLLAVANINPPVEGADLDAVAQAARCGLPPVARWNRHGSNFRVVFRTNHATAATRAGSGRTAAG